VADKRGAGAADPPGDRALPTGTVTFLFTDIEGSTRLLRADRQAYAAALALHRRLLRAAFAAHGGREVDTQGDGFFVAFPTAEQAVAAAADAQRSLAAQPWPQGARVSVRMGMHTGGATIVGATYVGLAVHRAARIAAAAAGGQVLLSEATAALVEDDPPTGMSVRPLGEHRLKDFPRNAPLFQLDVDGLPAQFPPLRTPGPHHRLPVPSDTLRGRDDDLAALVSLLTDSSTRLVTVTGPGGIGKTRLSIEVAHAVAEHFPGGAAFVPLGAITDPALVVPSLADAIGVRRETGVEPREAVRLALGDERTLLVLDNFEQVAAAASELKALLEGSPALVLLVTSRRALRLSVERQYVLAPLSGAAAVRLFTERAAATRPGFMLDADNAAVVAELCRRLDGLPLAIELAAARVHLLPPAALLVRLGERLELLGGGPVDRPARQQTLRATMDWSYHLLGAHERAVFIRLAAFSGGFTIPAAETVCGRAGEPGVLDALSALLDASLLVRTDPSSEEPRLDMLETVRDYAAERLDASSDRVETARRQAEWMLALTHSFLVVDASGYRQALARLDVERANLRAAVVFLIEDGDFERAALLVRNAVAYLARRDAEREASGWLDQMESKATEATAAVRGRLLVLRAVVAAARDDLSLVHAPLEEGRRLLPDDPDHEYDHALAALAGVFAALGDGSLEEASHRTEEAVARFAAIGQLLGLTFTAMIRVNLALLRSDYAGAERGYRAALDLASSIGDDALVGQVLSLQGLVQLSQGDVAAGRRSILDGAALNRRSRSPSTMVHGLEGLASVALIDGRPDVAARALAAAASARHDVATAVASALTPLIADVAARSREQLGDQTYNAACAEGRQWSLPHALDQTLAALADWTGPPTPQPGVKTRSDDTDPRGDLVQPRDGRAASPAGNGQP
jgi:predicted ATPase/class 3 adenylate cyclase